MYAPGSHFGVPIMNYFGWVLTIATIVAASQWLDRALQRTGVRLARGPRLPLEPLWGIGCCLGVFAFMLAINTLLLVNGNVPAGTPIGAVLFSGLISTGAFLAFTIVMIRRGARLASAAWEKEPMGATQ